jgi:hypothetical protein
MRGMYSLALTCTVFACFIIAKSYILNWRITKSSHSESQIQGKTSLKCMNKIGIFFTSTSVFILQFRFSGVAF